MFSIAAFALASALAASAADINITVGANNGLVFDPSSVQAQPGDMLHFEFQSKNHSVTQSTFASPCTKSPTGIDSGFMAVDANAASRPTWTFQVSDTTPLWFFCAQTQPAVHCTAGMVFAVNPTADKSFDAFQTAAKSGGAAPSAGGSNSTVSGVIPAPSSLPTAAGAGGVPSASGTGVAPPSGSGFSTAITSPSGTNTAAGATSTANPNGAVGLSSAGALSFISLFAAVAGFML